MEETQNTQNPQPESNYIDLSENSKNVGNIFNELSGELGELDFSERIVQTEEEKKNPLIVAYKTSGYIFIVGAVVALLLTLDIFIRSMEDNSILANLPICTYLSYGIDDYENSECKTLSMISAEITVKKDILEKNIIANLIILVPKFLQSLDIANSPKVQFIQEHTGNSRVSITEAISRFLEIKNRTSYQGEDIECKTLSLDEKGKISVSCQIYG